MKSWSYLDITEAAAAQISVEMERARRHPARAQEHRAYATGAYHLWFRVTAGDQRPGDAERLEQLITGD